MLIFVVACNEPPKGDTEQLDKEVKAFSEAYFNYKFSKAEKHCTGDSRKWLVYAASNIHDADIDMLRGMSEGASVDINDYKFNDDDTTGYAMITVHNYLRLDTIGNAGRVIKKADFKLPIVLRHDKWMIKMACLPRSEKQSHD